MKHFAALAIGLLVAARTFALDPPPGYGTTIVLSSGVVLTWYPGSNAWFTDSLAIGVGNDPPIVGLPASESQPLFEIDRYYPDGSNDQNLYNATTGAWVRSDAVDINGNDSNPQEPAPGWTSGGLSSSGQGGGSTSTPDTSLLTIAGIVVAAVVAAAILVFFAAMLWPVALKVYHVARRVLASV